MNLSVTLMFAVPTEEWNHEGIARIAQGVADSTFDIGYDNKEEYNSEGDLLLKSVIIVKAVKEDEDWSDIAEGAMSVSFPTADEGFIKAYAESDLNE